MKFPIIILCAAWEVSHAWIIRVRTQGARASQTRIRITSESRWGVQDWLESLLRTLILIPRCPPSSDARKLAMYPRKEAFIMGGTSCTKRSQSFSCVFALDDTNHTASITSVVAAIGSRLVLRLPSRHCNNFFATAEAWALKTRRIRDARLLTNAEVCPLTQVRASHFLQQRLKRTSLLFAEIKPIRYC